MSIAGKGSIGRRLAAGFAVVLILLSGVGAVGLIQASRIYDGTHKIADHLLPSVESLGSLQGSAEAVRRLTTRQLVSDDPKGAAAARVHHGEALARFAASLDDYAKLASSPEEHAYADNIKNAWAGYLETDSQIEALSEKGDSGLAEARTLSAGETVTRYNKAIGLITDDIKLNHDRARRAAVDAATSFERARNWTLVLVLVAFAAGVAIAVRMTRSIADPLRRSVEVAETVARGDLTSTIDVKGTDELGQLAFALRHMNERLVDMVGSVLSSSESIATGAAQIAAGNAELSQRTEEQAASLEQTASSMEQLTATVRQNTDNANEGNRLALRASETATSGGEVVSRVVSTMSEIATSSTQVAQIISVIEGIAFQTNILALNAAVEAARAGEQGRGFAVVAAEVRTLAQRSAAAAKDIKELIQHSVDRVSSGSALVDEAGRTMTGVMQSVGHVSSLMTEISTASAEQQSGIEQVSIAVGQMDEVTQRNAALVEEVSAAAQSMAEQSSALRALVSVFKLPAASGAQASLSAPRLASRS